MFNKKRACAAALSVVMAMSSTAVAAAASPVEEPAVYARQNQNLTIRKSTALLDQVISGNLTLAGELEMVQLTNVTVGGKIIARGEVENLTMENSTVAQGIEVHKELTFNGEAEKIVLPNTAELTVESGIVDLVHVDKYARGCEIEVEEQAYVGEIVLDSWYAEVEGDGTVDTIYVNAPHAEIDVPNAKVVVAEGVKHVTVGGVEVAPGSTVVQKPEGDGYDEFVEAKLVEEVKLVDLGWSQFLTVQFLDGNSLQNCTVTVDGVDVTSAFTPVSDGGSLVKWEVSALSHAKVVISNGTESQTLRIEKGLGEAPVVSGVQTPDYFLLNGPVYVWDYHLTNYDEAGNIRVSPKKTTMSLGQKEASIPSYSPDAIIYNDENALPYFVKGEAQLMFNYNTEEEKAFVDGITDVDLVSFDEYKKTLNDELTYTLDKAFPHGDHTVACVKVPIGQVNFVSNGRYNLRVISNGVARLFPIHLVNEVVPSMVVTGDTGYSGKEVHFRISDMTYGITSPIYRVDLTDTNGNTVTLNKFDDWFLHGDLLVLYNDHTNYFPVDGNYTVTVYANGFQTFSKTFYQTAFLSDVDAISTASVGGGGSSGGGDAGDTKVMNANLIVNSDLMVNAQIVNALGLSDPYAPGIADRWTNMSKLYVFNTGAETVYTAENYFDAVNTARTEGEYLTFDEYVASGNAVTTPNRPYAVKQVLEDNLLGETSSFREAVGMEVPALTLTAQTETSAVFTCEDAAYLSKLSEGEILLNRDYPALTAEEYTVDGNTLTLHTVKVGKNTLKIRVPGYKTTEIRFNIDKVLEEVALTAQDIEKGDPIVITCEAQHEAACDFFANIQSVTLTAPNGKTDNVMPDGAESLFEEIGYTVDGNVLTIGKDVFDLDFAKNDDGSFLEGAYKVTLNAEYYGTQELTVNVTAPAAQTMPAPAVKEITYKTQFMGGNYYNVAFEGTEDDTAAFVAAISNISINGQKVTPVASFFNDTMSYKTSADPAFGGASRFVDFTEDCFKGEAKVVISADGYEDLTFTVKDGTLVESVVAAPSVDTLKFFDTMTADYYELSFQGDAEAYLKAVSRITLNGKEAEKVTGLWNETFAYQFANDPAFGGENKFIHFSQDCFKTGSVEVVIHAKGYADLTFTVKDGQLLLAPPAFHEVTLEKDMFRGDHYRLAFSDVDAVSSASTGGGSVNPGIPELPEPTPEMKALYNYVSTLKTYLNEEQDAFITLNGNLVEESKNPTLENFNSYLVIADEHDMGRNAVVFSLDCFQNQPVEVVITVPGYEDLKFTVEGVEVPSQPNPDPEPEVPQTGAPVVKSIEHKLSAFSGNSYVVKLTNPEGVTDDQLVYNFLRSLKEVTVNNVVFTEAGSFGALADNQYRLNASAGEIVFSENTFGKGTGEFAVTLTNGTDVTSFRVVDGQLAAAPAVPAAPAVKEITPKSSFTGSSYTISFNGDEAAVEAYLNAVTSITVNGTALKKVSSFFGENMAYKTSSDPTYGGAYCFLDLTADCLADEATVVISAEGYQDLTFTAVDGKMN